MTDGIRVPPKGFVAPRIEQIGICCVVGIAFVAYGGRKCRFFYANEKTYTIGSLCLSVSLKHSDKLGIEKEYPRGEMPDCSVR